MSDLRNIHLEWVLVEGELHHVSDFAHLPAPKRPPAFCPVCSRQVRLKLGDIRVHHCAHAPDVDCVATQPETIIHLNTKLYIYRQLQQTQKITVVEECNYGDWISETAYMFLPQAIRNNVSQLRCQEKREYIWLQEWDNVAVEYSVGSRRPDITLFYSDQIIGAIEVCVSHAVDEEKARYLKELGIPWLEIMGTEGFYTGESAWTPNKPLPILRMQPAEWICDPCSKIIELEEYRYNNHIRLLGSEDRKADGTLKEFRHNNCTRPYAVRIVDYFFSNGTKYREVFSVIEVITDGQRSEMLLQDQDGVILATQTAPITESSMKVLSQEFRNQLARRRRTKAIVDSPMKWNRDILLGRYKDKSVVFGNRYYPRRYVWLVEEKKWFLPQENKTISWDKPSKET